MVIEIDAIRRSGSVSASGYIFDLLNFQSNWTNDTVVIKVRVPSPSNDRNCKRAAVRSFHLKYIYILTQYQQGCRSSNVI